MHIPANAMAMFIAAAWNAEPMVKMTTAIKIDPLRPKRSATGPLTREPNQAASNRVETNQPLKELSVAMRGKRAAKLSMVRTPEITP
jgi:hypothetical protein